MGFPPLLVAGIGVTGGNLPLLAEQGVVLGEVVNCRYVGQIGGRFTAIVLLRMGGLQRPPVFFQGCRKRGNQGFACAVLESCGAMPPHRGV